jgi:hypothetical protein
LKRKTINLGEYVITIKHGDNGFLLITVKDELGEEIETIHIVNDSEENVDDKINPTLN